jgi:hypothetical protein
MANDALAIKHDALPYRSDDVREDPEADPLEMLNIKIEPTMCMKTNKRGQNGYPQNGLFAEIKAGRVIKDKNQRLFVEDAQILR